MRTLAWVFTVCSQKERTMQICESVWHYKNTPIQIYIENFTTKNWKFSDKNSDIFHIFAQCWEHIVEIKDAQYVFNEASPRGVPVPLFP